MHMLPIIFDCLPAMLCPPSYHNIPQATIHTLLYVKMVLAPMVQTKATGPTSLVSGLFSPISATIRLLLPEVLLLHRGRLSTPLRALARALKVCECTRERNRRHVSFGVHGDDLELKVS
jgi:hypothetical protein